MSVTIFVTDHELHAFHLRTIIESDRRDIVRSHSTATDVARYVRSVEALHDGRTARVEVCCALGERTQQVARRLRTLGIEVADNGFGPIPE
jgi:rhodanese-related sulfurtransferase